MRVKEILSTPENKLPKWIRDVCRLNSNPRLVWIGKGVVHYYTRYGGCCLTLGPDDYLISVPAPEHWGKNVWEITGYLKENFRKRIERF